MIRLFIKSAMEIKLSSFIIGILQLIWAAVVSMDSGGRLPQVMELYHAREAFSVLLAASSMLILLGSVFPCRALRHTGLWLTPCVLLPAFGLMVHEQIISVASYMLPFISMMALFIMYIDVRGKPRYGKTLDS